MQDTQGTPLADELSITVDTDEVVDKVEDLEKEPETKAEPETEPETPEEPTTPEDKAEDKPKKQSGVQKRIGELTKDKYDALRERDYWRDLALQKVSPLEDAQEDVEPTLADCDGNLEEYSRKLSEYHAKQAAKAVEQKFEEQQANQVQTEAQRAHSERETEARDKYADYDVVAHDPRLPITPEMADVIVSSSVGPDIAYFLGSHPQEAARIAQLPATRQAYEIGRVEAALTAPKVSPPPTTTKAPEPHSTVKGTTPVKPAPEEMSYEEYAEHRRKQL